LIYTFMFSLHDSDREMARRRGCRQPQDSPTTLNRRWGSRWVMRALLLDRYGYTLKVRNDARGTPSLVLTDDTDPLLKVVYPPRPDITFDSVLVRRLGGFVTWPALRWLADNGVPITMVDYDGRPLASFVPHLPNPSNGARLRLAQIRCRENPRMRLLLAREVLRAKLGKPVPTGVNTIEKLRKFEAEAAEVEWKRLGVRRFRPHASDTRNVCCNYAFGLLESRVRLAVSAVGLEPSIGFLHEPTSSLSALVYDLMEPFRFEVARLAVQFADSSNGNDYLPAFRRGRRLRRDAARDLVLAFEPEWDDQRCVESVERFARMVFRLGEPKQRLGG
jgi:CRISP-associated protein Cas1